MNITHTTDVGAILWYFCLFSPKIGYHGNGPLSLVYGRVTDEFLHSTNHISKPNSAWICCIYKWSYCHFVIFWLILAKIRLPWQRPLDSCNQKCLLWIGLPWKPPAISNAFSLSVVEMHLYAFIAILVQKLVAVVTPLYALCTRCHRWIPRWHKPYLKTKLCIIMTHTTEVVAIFVIFLPILAKIWLPWQRSVDTCNQKWNGRPRTKSNHILVISRRNAFSCIYSNFSPKIGCHNNAPLSLVYGFVTHEFADSTNPFSKPNSAWICCIQLKLWPFLWFFCLFLQKFGCHDNVLRPLQSEISSLDWSTTKSPCYK